MSIKCNEQIKFIPFCKENMKFLSGNILMSCGFILLSSTKPILSITNSAWYVLLWYIISLVLLLLQNWYKTRYNNQNRTNRKLLKKYNYRKNLTAKEKKRIINFKKEKVEFGGWSFIATQLIVSLIFILFLYSISLILQFIDYSNYMIEQKDFFMNIFMSTFVTTLFASYYSLIINKVKKKKGLKNKLKSLFIYNNASLIKRIIGNLLLYLMLLYAFIYSLFSFTIVAPLFVGVLYVGTLLKSIDTD